MPLPGLVVTFGVYKAAGVWQLLTGTGTVSPGTLSARWSTAHSSKVNLHHTLDFRDFCGAVTSKLRSGIRGNETLELHRVGGVEINKVMRPKQRKERGVVASIV